MVIAAEPSVSPLPTFVAEMRILAEMWRRSMVAANYSPNTIEACVKVAGEWFPSFCATLDDPPEEVGEVRREHVEAWVTHLLGKGKSSTARTYHAKLSQFFTYLVDKKELDVSPMVGMKPPKLEEGEVPVIPLEDVTALLKSCDSKSFEDIRDEAFIRLFYDLGIRLAECSTLDLGRVNLTHETITVIGKASRTRAARERTVQISGQKTLLALMKYLRARAKHPKCPSATSGPLWYGPKGPLTPNGIRQAIQRRSTRVLGYAIHPHQFRHTNASTYLENGGQETDLMRNLGWESRTMVGRYAKATAAKRARAEAKRIGLGDLV